MTGEVLKVGNARPYLVMLRDDSGRPRIVGTVSLIPAAVSEMVAGAAITVCGMTESRGDTDIVAVEIGR